LHVDTCLGEPSEMVFALLGVNEMEGFIPLVEAFLDERAKHAVLLVGAVEERANVTMLAESAPRDLQGMPVGVHFASTQESNAERVAFYPGKPDDSATVRFDPARSSGTPGLDFHGWSLQDTRALLERLTGRSAVLIL
jgi:hypothetical protein